MWLIDTETIELKPFFGSDSSIPDYAILSHTWEDEEVTFQDMASPAVRVAKRGFEKIKQTCRLAVEQELKYAWVDTCCINKESSAELTESINSMFAWYQKAEVCFVYLSDYLKGEEPTWAIEGCRWFTRGWTLQELIAPAEIEFYDRDWTFLGEKDELVESLKSITGIPDEAITGDIELGYYSVAQRMSWAAKRETTRIEDQAYSLLGLFNINMPMIYGEGQNAFIRLQEEIIKRNADLTILAWNTDASISATSCMPLASSPSMFLESGSICKRAWEGTLFALNNGIDVTGARLLLQPWRDKTGRPFFRYLLQVGWTNGRTGKEGGRYHCLPLRKVGVAKYVRETENGMPEIPKAEERRLAVTPLHNFFLAGPEIVIKGIQQHSYKYRGATHITTSGDIFPQCLKATIPSAAYDHSSGVCYEPQGSHYDFCALEFIAHVGDVHAPFGLLIGYPTTYSVPRVIIVDTTSSQGSLLFLLLRRNPSEAMQWQDIDAEFPEIAQLGTSLKVFQGSKVIEIVGNVSEQRKEFHLWGVLQLLPDITLNAYEVA